jgi:RNA polymerase sigma-70 factor (ECF subfamily)
MNSTAAVFATTHWSVVLAAGQSDDAKASAALEQLCRTYRYPLYAYLRRRGHTSEDAQDLTQGFFLQLLERRSFARADPSRGRFHSYLLAGLNYFVADAHARAVAQKRGGGQPTLSLDADAAAERYRLEAVDERSPDKLFERCWALALLEQVLARLEQEFVQAGKAPLFQRLRDFLVIGAGEESYANVAAEMGMTSEAVKKAVQRLRRRYHKLFREEIARTVEDASSVEDELRYLCEVMAR